MFIEKSTNPFGYALLVKMTVNVMKIRSTFVFMGKPEIHAIEEFAQR